MHLFNYKSHFFEFKIVIYRRNPMTISSPEREAKKVKIAVDRNPVETSLKDGRAT